MASKNPAQRLRDILENIDLIGEFTRGLAYDSLAADGAVIPPSETGDALENCPEIRLAPGTAAALIDSDRDEW